MVIQIVCILLLASPSLSYEEYEELKDYDNYENRGKTTMQDQTSIRAESFQFKPNRKTLSPEDLHDVTGVLRRMFSNMPLENRFTPFRKFKTVESEIPHEMSESIANTEVTTVSPAKFTQVTGISPGIFPPNTEITSVSPATFTANTDFTSISPAISTTEKEFMSVSTAIPANTGTSTVTSDSDTSVSSFETTTTDSTETSTEPTIVDTSISFRGDGESRDCENCNLPTSTCHPTPEYSPVINLPILMKIIANLTGEFESNLSQRLNKTLHDMGLPTCPTPTVEPPTTSQYDANYTGSIVGKCYVCGLDVEGVPRHAHCADAFAGDFLPLVPIDPTARSQLSKYKKYCTYAHNPGYAFNETRPRSVFGRFTGGCGVRWTDLSGIYTQRTCRNRLNPMMGKHFASKRMAKLEKSLWHIDNGCIISPMATLIPLSRGISLYARFHACVCTGNWCNTCGCNTPWILFNLITFLIAFLIS